MEVLPSGANDRVHLIFIALAIDESSGGDFSHLLREDLDIVLIERLEKAVTRLSTRQHLLWVYSQGTHSWSPTSDTEVLGNNGIHQFLIVTEFLRHLLPSKLCNLVSDRLSSMSRGSSLPLWRPALLECRSK